MLPFCNETITIVRHIQSRTADTYTCEVVVGVSWHGKRAMSPNASGGLSPVDAYQVRIPAELAPDPLPKADDFIVRGILPHYSGRKDLEQYEHFVASSVTDNRRGRLAHILVVNT